MAWLRYPLLGLAGLALLGAAAAQVLGAPRLGELWFRLDPFSLNLVQAITQRYLHPALWDHLAVPLLLSPAAAVALAIAAVLALFAWLVRARH